MPGKKPKNFNEAGFESWRKISLWSTASTKEVSKHFLFKTTREIVDKSGANPGHIVCNLIFDSTPGRRAHYQQSRSTHNQSYDPC